MSLAFGYLNFFLNLAIKVWVEIRDRTVVDRCELESSGKTWQQFPVFVFGNDRCASVPEKFGDGFLGKPDMFSDNPEIIQFASRRVCHLHTLQDRETESVRIDAKSSVENEQCASR